MLRVYVTGRVTVEGPGGVLDQADLPGRQGRRALVHLAVERQHPVPVEVLSEMLWPEDAPRTAGTSLRAIISKLRGALADVAHSDGDPVVGEAGCYQLRVSGGVWVDVEAAANHLDQAEGALRRGDVSAAWAGATVASSVASRPLLPGEDDPWLAVQRERLRRLRLRALDCLTDVWLGRQEHALAAEMARGAVELAPFREEGHRRLMAAHLGAGNRAEALRVYEQLRDLLATELGVDPSPETEDVYLEALRAG